MPILNLLLVLAVFGFLLWLITTYIPMPDPIKKIIVVIAVVFLVIWLLSSIGALDTVNVPIRVHH
jgi:hypothetical protein